MAKKPKSEEAADDASDKEKEAPAAGGSKKKLMIMAVAGLLGLGGVGGGVWFFFLKKKPTAEAQAATPKKQVAFVEMKDLMVNLAQIPGQERQNYLKMKIALEVADPKFITDIQPLLPRIEDTFHVYMRELRVGELEGSAAIFRLKEELLKRVNIAVYPAKVDAVLFKEILVQ